MNDTHVLITGDKVGATKINAAAKKGVKVVPWSEFKHLVESAELSAVHVKLLACEFALEEADDPTEVVRLRAREAVLVRRAGGELEERDYSAEERKKMAASGQALPDGSFPIKDRADLANAITRLPQAKDRGKALRHIRKRAAALGAKGMTEKHKARLHA